MLSFFLPRRRRRNHSGLRLTALLLMIALICSITNTAKAAGEAIVSTQSLYDAVQGTRDTFIQLYRAIWQENSLDSQLRAAIRRAVNNELEGKVSSSFHLIAKREQAIENIQEGVTAEFNETYEKFLGELQKRFSDEYAKKLTSYYKIAAANALGRTQKPISKGFISAQSNKLLENNGAALKDKINLSLKEKFPGLITFGVDGGALVVGLLTTIFRDRMISFLVNQVGLQTLATGVGAKIASSAIPVVGILLAGYGVLDLASTIWNAPDTLRKELENRYSDYFKKEAPQNVWKAMDDPVTEGFKTSAKQLEVVLANADKLASDPEVQRLTNDLSNEKKIEFCQKLATITMSQGISYDDTRFIKDFGAALLKTDVAKLDTLFAIINKNRTAAIDWFALAEPEEILELFSNLQSGTWEKFAPNEESLNTLRWVSKNLSATAQSKALELDPSDISWLMTDLPSKYLTLLLTSQHSSIEIMGEIERLREIPEKEARRPWQSAMEGMISKYLPYIKYGVITLFVLTVLAKLKDLFMSRKS